MRGLDCFCQCTLPLNLCKLNLICQVFKINLESLTIPYGFQKLKSLWAKLLKNASGFVFCFGTCKKHLQIPTILFQNQRAHLPLCVITMRSHGALTEPRSFNTGIIHPQTCHHSPKEKYPTQFRKG